MEKKFRFSNKYVFLTYKNHILQKELQFLNGLTYKLKLCHEVGKTGHKHTHILIAFDKELRTRNCRFFDVNDNHPNIKRILTKKQWKNTVNYLEKDNDKCNSVIIDTLTGHEYEYLATLREIIQGNNSWKECLNSRIADTQQFMKYLNWARQVFDARPQPNLSQGVTLREWQQQEILHLELQDRRKIRWIWSRDGGEGKSILADYLIDNYNAFFCEGGAYKDIAYAYDGQEYAVFDLPRTSEEFSDGIFKAIESLKNGRLFSSKYASVMKRFKPVKVIVMANYYPNLTKLSSDRWDIEDISRHKLTGQVFNIKGETCLEYEENDEKLQENLGFSEKITDLLENYDDL